MRIEEVKVIDFFKFKTFIEYYHNFSMISNILSLFLLFFAYLIYKWVIVPKRTIAYYAKEFKKQGYEV